MHTRTAYKLIPVPALERKDGVKGEGEGRGVKPKKEAVEVEKDSARERKRNGAREAGKKTGRRGLITSPGPALTLVHRGLSRARE